MSDRRDRYWICHKCEKKKGLKPGSRSVTMITALCWWCDFPDKVPLVPLRDLRTSDGKSGMTLLEEK